MKISKAWPISERAAGMAAPNVKAGQRVEVIGRDGLCGTVAYVGTTQFAPGKWIGKNLLLAFGTTFSFSRIDTGSGTRKE